MISHSNELKLANRAPSLRAKLGCDVNRVIKLSKWRNQGKREQAGEHLLKGRRVAYGALQSIGSKLAVAAAAAAMGFLALLVASLVMVI